jgi:hypothetical protein
MYKKSKYLIISTDLETDDICAIDILYKNNYFKNIEKILFVVGEGNSDIKYNRMKYYISNFYNTIKNKVKIIKGYSSKIKNKYDGYGEINKNDHNCGVDDENIENVIYAFIKKNSPDIISIKPPKEIFEIFNQHNKNIHKIFNKCNFFGYMGFNLRVCFRTYNKKTIIDCLSSFRNCFWIHTHFSLNSKCNVITPHDINFKKLDPHILNVMKYWNKHQMEYAIERIEQNIDTKKHVVMKNIDKLKNIIHYDGNQFVHADTLLALFLTDPDKRQHLFIRGNIEFDEKTGHSKFSENIESGKFLVLKPSDKTEYRKYQMKLFNKYLEL